jgi:hypothetical protein
VIRQILKPLSAQDTLYTQGMVQDQGGDAEDVAADEGGTIFRREEMWAFQEGRTIPSRIISQFVRLTQVVDNMKCTSHMHYNQHSRPYYPRQKSLFLPTTFVGVLLTPDQRLKEDVAACLEIQVRIIVFVISTTL